MLGDGFVPVYETNLVPVVGFHSNGESVRVNFGLVPFAYEVQHVLEVFMNLWQERRGRPY